MVHHPLAMYWSPLGKFNSYFSIVSTLRGQYITVNESCQFYYHKIKAPLRNQTILKKTHAHLPPL